MLDTLEALKAFKRGKTFAKASYELNIPERQLGRWIRGEFKISPAWDIILRQRLKI